MSEIEQLRQSDGVTIIEPNAQTMRDYRMSWMNSMTKSAQPTIKSESSLTQSKKPVKPVRKA